jgi:ATP-dependent DNA helicase RecG
MSDSPSEAGLERLRVMEATTDGFVLAERDLEMRGPGDFFGVRQHGLPELRVASLADTMILELAREQALALFESDPGLKAPEHQPMASAVAQFWSRSYLA